MRMKIISKETKRKLTSRSFESPTSWCRVPWLSVSKEEYKQARHAYPQLASRASLKLWKRASHLRDTIYPPLAKRYAPGKYNKKAITIRAQSSAVTYGEACNPSQCQNSRSSWWCTSSQTSLYLVKCPTYPPSL